MTSFVNMLNVNGLLKLKSRHYDIEVYWFLKANECIINENEICNCRIEM